jgi:hypothetical protein
MRNGISREVRARRGFVTLLKQSWALFLVVSLLTATAPAGFADQADEPAASAPVGAGREEVLFRRIGGNEATAIETCHALVLTRQREENTTTGDNPVTQYAQTLVSAHRVNAGSDAPADKAEPSGPFHGYYFRMLNGQPKNSTGASAGFAFIAYPAEYRSSGVMTFVVTEDNVVCKKDLGPDAAKLAEKMTAGAPGSSWHTAE